MTTTPIENRVTATSMVCEACGYLAPLADPRPFRCPNAGGNADHVMKRRVNRAGLASALEGFSDAEPDPFIRYRRLTHPWQTAMALGISDGEYVELVRDLEKRIAAIDGSGFGITPFELQPELARAVGFPGDILVKNETGNVSGSHKGRHLMGLMLWLQIMERSDPAMATARLAIASCGNAALAAATVARAARRDLDVYVPSDASAVVIAQLEQLGARVRRCPRRPGEAGDPSYLRFREAVAAGALPFTCQGNENGLVIEGCQTLGWEIGSQLMATGRTIDRIFVQVGGGALASAVIAAFEDLQSLGVLAQMPRVHCVQTASAFPLRRAYERVIARITGDVLLPRDYARLDGIASRLTQADVEEAMRYAVAHRQEFMWPWESVPESVAHGILDDETYDWAAVVRGMLVSHGYPLVVSEQQLIGANRLAVASTGIPVDPTGSSGLAGVLELVEHRSIASGETLAVLFTGRTRE